MIRMSYEEIEERILKDGKIGKEELEKRVKDKMDQLSGLISKEGAAYIIANELGVKLIQTEGIIKVKNVVVGMRSVEAQGKVVRKFPVKEFERNGSMGKVGSFFMADDTGQIRITAWNSQADLVGNLKEGDIVWIKDGYVRDNQGQKEIHINDRSKLIVNPEGVSFDSVSTSATGAGALDVEKKKISELAETDQNVYILATVVQVFDPRFFEVCPECGRRALQQNGDWTCQDHGKVAPAYSYVMNAVLDDGTDNIRAVFFKNQACNLLGKTDEEMQGYRSEPEKLGPVKDGLLGEQVKVTGRASKNEMFDRLEFIARFVDRDVDPKKEMESLRKEAAVQDAKKSESQDAQGRQDTALKDSGQEEVPDEDASLSDDSPLEEETIEDDDGAPGQTGVDEESDEEKKKQDNDPKLPSIDDI